MRTWKDETIKRELNRLAEGLQEVDKTIISYVRISMGNLSDTRTVTVYTDFAKDEWLFKATFDFEVNTITLECRGVEPCTNRISSLKRSVNTCIETFNCTFDEFEYYYGVPYKHYLPTAEAEEIAEQSVQQEGRTLTVTLHPEDEEEEITITYEDAKGFHHVVGQEALEIEKSTDGISIDKDHVYIVIEFLDGSEATFRRSSVVRIAEEGHVLLERDPEPTPEEADREVTYIDFKPEQDYSEEEPKVENSKVKAAAQYLSNKITGWYENARIDYGVNGKFLSCKAEGENGIRINWEENGKEYTMVINWFTEYTTEHLYNIWMEQGVEVEEVKPEPNKITDVKAFFDKLVRSFDDAGFGTSCKQLSKSEYSIHAISSPNGEVTITLNLNTGYLWHSADVTVYSGTDCIIIDYAKYSTEADFIKAITEKVIASKREKELEKVTKFFKSTDSTSNKVLKLRKEFKQWEVLQEREKEADEAYEANYKNKELEKAADEAFEVEYKQYDKIARMIAELINVEVLTAKSMLTNGAERVKKILGL